MTRRAPNKPSPVRGRAAYRLAAACGTGLLAAGLTAPHAAAAPARPGRAARADDNNAGNGHHNRSALSVRSPSYNHGYQHTRTGNAGGANSVQNALCRGASVCNVTQNVTIVRPAPSEPEQPDPFIYLGPYGLALMVPQDPAPPADAAPAMTAAARFTNIPSRPRAVPLRRDEPHSHRESSPRDRRRPG